MTVEIWSDVVCPWCYIGKRRFEQALERFEHGDEVEVRWRSFELDPTAGASDAEAGKHYDKLAAKFGMPVEQARSASDQLAETAAAEGLSFRWDLARTGNSFDAHRLLHLAAGHGRQDELKERLDRGTFTEGMPSSDHGALRAVAVEIGLSADEVDAVLASDRYADAVRADEEQARAYGITGVPFFVLDARFGVSGAQPADTMLAALKQAWDARQAG